MACRYDVVVVTDILVPLVLRPDDDLLGLVHVGGSDRADLTRHRGGEEQEVTLLRYFGEDRLEALREAHRQHLVSFVEDNRLDAVEAGCTTLHEVDEATRSGDDDLYTTAKRTYLCLDGRAPIDGEDAYRGEVLAIGREVVSDLQTELAGRAEDEGAWCSDAIVGLSLKASLHVLQEG